MSGTALAAGLSPEKSPPRDATTPVASAIPLTDSDSLLTLPATEVYPVRKRAIPKQRVALALGGALLMLLAAVVYRIQTDKGTLVVTIEDPAVQAILEQDALVIRDKHSDRTWTIKATETKPLPSGKYQVEGKPNLQLLVTDDSGAELTTDTFTLKRKGEVRVQVTLEQDASFAGKETATSTTSDPDRRAAEYVLSIGGDIFIKVNGWERWAGAVGDLPQGAFELTWVNLNGNQKVSDAGLAHFKDCTNLKGFDGDERPDRRRDQTPDRPDEPGISRPAPHQSHRRRHQRPASSPPQMPDPMGWNAGQVMSDRIPFATPSRETCFASTGVKLRVH